MTILEPTVEGMFGENVIFVFQKLWLFGMLTDIFRLFYLIDMEINIFEPMRILIHFKDLTFVALVANSIEYV